MTILARLRLLIEEYEGSEHEAPVTRQRPKLLRNKDMTFRDLGDKWTSGRLHQQYPDQVRAKDPLTVSKDARRLAALYTTLGDLPLRDITIGDAEAAMTAITAKPRKRPLRPGSRRHYAGLISRLMKLAHYPLGVIERSPIPDGFVPPQGKSPAFTILYPSEEFQLVKHPSIEFRQRLLYGFLSREGLRISEAIRLRWSDLDLQRGTIRVDKNKTGNPRMWRLGDDVVRALLGHRGTAKGSGHVFAGVPTSDAAGRFREHLELARVDRSDLHDRTAERRPIRVHDLRGTFVTLALAKGESETWVCDRTGHQSSQMLSVYRRQARHAAELELGWLYPLDRALKGLKGDEKMPRKKAPSKNTGSTYPGNAAVNLDPVDEALAFALQKAANESEWATVGKLAIELQARRVERTGGGKVTSLDEARKRKNGDQ